MRRVALDSLKEAGVVAIGCGDVASTGKGATRLASAETKVMILVEEILCNSLSLSQSIISKTSCFIVSLFCNELILNTFISAFVLYDITHVDSWVMQYSTSFC